jgi:hypothetical protein
MQHLIYPIAASFEPPAKRYQTAFKAPENRSAFSSAAPLTFDSHTFKRTFCTVDERGEITLVEKSDSETILIAQGWMKFINGTTPSGGYLSKGYSKYAFRVSFSSKLTRSSANLPPFFCQGLLGTVHHAIFQTRSFGGSGSTEVENAVDLTNELKVLSVAQYFLESFIKRAAAYGYTSLPSTYFDCVLLIDILN